MFKADQTSLDSSVELELNKTTFLIISLFIGPCLD